MPVVATLSKGYDLDYIWKHVDHGPAKDAASYYIQASESGGEPPGRWWGPGAAALGFRHGQRIERKPYDLLFGERQAPDGTPLGRPPSSGRKAADLYAALLAAEPHATAERRRELRTEAVQKARPSPLFFDLTLLLSKSISIFHASLGENARLARQAGDKEGDQYWNGLVAEVDDMIWQAVHAGFEYLPARSRLHPPRDRKSTALKSLQGKIWKKGFECGELKGDLFPDVPEAFARWAAKARVAIYSSGSVEAQRMVFRYSIFGDLTPLISGYLDTRAGPKQASSSYVAIAAAMNVEPGLI